jgi:hypothetical protein
VTDTNIENDTVEQAKARARAEIEAHRDRKRREREAKARADLTAEEEIGAAIALRRQQEAEQAKVRAELDSFWARREAQLKAQREAEQAAGGYKLGHSVAPTPAHRVARLLRQRLGDDFDALVADIRGCDFRQLQAEIARIPHDERAEALAREREAQAAALAEAARTMPEPEDTAESAILMRYGLSAVRAAELDAGAL